MPDMDPIGPRMITMVLFCQHAAHRVALALWRTLERGLAQVLHLVPGQKRRELAALRTRVADQEQREREAEVRARQHEIEVQIVLESMLTHDIRNEMEASKQ
ncbi:hypothetical protein KSD_84190 [Ktedonobacter sp. SOSP1-85]|uniref:hypothetical protein n=1 Tax=Ktedonobacter sp. SOSP1-85 TaxID=2778367 RepID=UPI0019162CF9|nr:hypothetical protein [Ktedonobacter sp. SOSP1-85]GHO80648.1 hypothetical protein KSD_84190 [Ktedonobacter sp. SOSP1-85]